MNIIQCALQHLVGDFARLLHAAHNFYEKVWYTGAPISVLVRIAAAKVSIAITNWYGDRGSPCLTPLLNSKLAEKDPLFMMQLDTLV